MDIEWIDSYCDKKPGAPHAHYFTATLNVDGGSIFFCTYCHRVKWLPNTIQDAELFNKLTKKFDAHTAYNIILHQRSAARRMLLRIKDIYLLERVLSPLEFAQVLSAATELERALTYEVPKPVLQ